MPVSRLVSVVVPTYNRADTLACTLDSVLAQSYDHFEIIVVDDGSTDGTRELVASRYGGEPRIRYTWQENRGVTGARNTALAMVGGDHVAFLDSDDCWEPWKLQLQLACLKRVPDAGMVWTNLAALDAGGNVIDAAFLRNKYGAYRVFSDDELFSDSWALADVVPELADVVRGARLYYGVIYPQIIMGSLVHTSTVLMTRERQLLVGAFDPDLEPAGEDHDYHLRTAREGSVCLADVAAIRYRVGREDALSRPSQGIHIARNNLKTLDKAVARHRGVALPARLVHNAYAIVHTWLGDLMLQAGNRTSARRELLRSLRRKPWQPYAAGLLLIACLPEAFGRRARRAVGVVKRGLHRVLDAMRSG